jgi:hypothetical protein
LAKPEKKKFLTEYFATQSFIIKIFEYSNAVSGGIVYHCPKLTLAQKKLEEPEEIRKAGSDRFHVGFGNRR